MNYLPILLVALAAILVIIYLRMRKYEGPTAYLFTSGADRDNITGERIMVKGGVAYDMDEAADRLVREGSIPLKLLPGVDLEKWIDENNLYRADRPLSEDELGEIKGGE